MSDQPNMSELPQWIQERIRNSAVSQLSEPMRLPRVCPVCMADSMVDSEAKYRQFMAGTEATPGRDYDCTECGAVWSVPLVSELASFQSIDWSQPQPDGVYRCQEGWSDTGGAEYGCAERGMTECSDGNLRCTDHALIFELAGIRQVMATGIEHAVGQADFTDHYRTELLDSIKEVSTALWEINYSHMSLHRRIWYRCRGWLYKHRVQRPTHHD